MNTIAGKQNNNREIVYRLVENGKGTAYIREVTGLSRSMVSRYRLELADQGGMRKKDRIKIRPGFWTEWTIAVNRIRRYMGKKPFPLPEE